ncbi:MAG: hypothetical protein VX185_00795 [Pseudomonadota bacterium]|nr:hypothetical protein [Pseudomonadota bacterium]
MPSIQLESKRVAPIEQMPAVVQRHLTQICVANGLIKSLLNLSQASWPMHAAVFDSLGALNCIDSSSYAGIKAVTQHWSDMRQDPCGIRDFFNGGVEQDPLHDLGLLLQGKPLVDSRDVHYNKLMQGFPQRIVQDFANHAQEVKEVDRKSQLQQMHDRVLAMDVSIPSTDVSLPSRGMLGPSVSSFDGSSFFSMQ